MLEHNQFGLKPGVYKHFKGPMYVVENIITHKDINGIWTKMVDPIVVYRHLEQAYEEVDGQKKMIIQTFQKKLSEFMSDKVLDDGTTVVRFMYYNTEL